MSSTPVSEAPQKVAKPATPAAPAAPSPSLKVYDFDFAGTRFEMDASISEEERRFYHKMYPTVDIVNQRKVHCTVCRMHIGTAPNSESNIKMHPILRVTHCVKCHDFYNSGEFSKGEDGSELYCRWCGQGGEVYCCSTCPFVFCKSCIVKNLSRGVIVDIEQNENWNCFKCTSKILWPLRAQHWALINYIETQKNGLQTLPLPEAEVRRLMTKDSSNCCRLAKAKASGLSDSMESLESNTSKRSHASSANSTKKASKAQGPPTKRPKSTNDEVVCTPDLLSILEPDCQISVAPKPAARSVAPPPNVATTPRILNVQQNYTGPSPSAGPSPSPSTSISSISNGNNNSSGTPRSSLPPPLVLSSSGMRYRQTTPSPAAVVRRTVVPNAVRSAGPVFHTINGFRVDLNSAAQQDSYRLPNGRLIQVKRQVPAGQQSSSTTLSPAPQPVSPQVIIRQRPAAPQRILHNPGFGSNMGIYNPQTNQQQRAPQVVRVNNGSQIHSINLAPPSATPPNSNGGTTIMMTPAAAAKVPTLVRHVFPNSPIGTARSQLQEQIFNAMEICTHLTGKVQTLTHSNAYNQARSYMDLKELYIHLSYLMTYAIGRFKQLQDKCLVDMREMGFKNDANSLENGQLAAAVDYVCYGQLDDVDLFNTGCNSFHNQVYEYRKSLHANLKDGESLEPLPPLMPLGVRAEGDPKDEEEEQESSQQLDNENDEPDDYNDDELNDDVDDLDDDDDLDDEYDALGTEESMNRNEQAHAYDRKLTRLLREYPSIWCTRHPDYGKSEVTRKQWRVIASHFPRGDDIKLRWKNVRKRYVRIERLLKLGRRFKGYFDKATNYLANRDLPRSDWLSVDCGEDDGDGFERKQLDAIENTIHKEPKERIATRLPVRPLEVRPIDLRIINFAKSHPVLWRKSADPEFNSIDEQTRKSLWQNFWKSAPKKQASDDEDNEIEIVEPKTDTITIDSDNEEERPSTSAPAVQKGLKITSVKSQAVDAALAKVDPVTANMDPNADIDVAAFSSSILASLLEVDITEGSGEAKTNSSVSPGGTVQKKQPRKKTTNKPNPALLHLERQRMEEIKKNDAKLKMKVQVKLKRAEYDFVVARQWIDEQKRLAKEKLECQKLQQQKTEAESENSGKKEATMPAEKESNLANPESSQPSDESKDMDTTDDPKTTKPEDVETKKQPSPEVDTADGSKTTSSKDTEVAKTANEKDKTEIEVDQLKSSQDEEIKESSESSVKEKANVQTMETTENTETLSNIDMEITEESETIATDAPNTAEAEISEKAPVDKEKEEATTSTKSESAIDAMEETLDKGEAKTDSVLPAEEAEKETEPTKAADSENNKSKTELPESQIKDKDTEAETNTETKEVSSIKAAEPSEIQTQTCSDNGTTSKDTEDNIVQSDADVNAA